MKKILVTCPPMANIINDSNLIRHEIQKNRFDITMPSYSNVAMSEAELEEIIEPYDGWIFADEPATKRVLKAGKNLKGCVRWGVGTDNIDWQSFKELNIPIKNTPGVFGEEVADIAMHYITGLARHTYLIDRAQKQHKTWVRPTGRSLWGTSGLIVGLGSIGKALAKRMTAHGMKVSYCDPGVESYIDYERLEWPFGMKDKDFVIFCCPLQPDTKHMLNESTLGYAKDGVNIINVARGQLISEKVLVKGIQRNKIALAALDVFENEPVPEKSPLYELGQSLIFGSHNGSNTYEAVTKVSQLSINLLADMLYD